MSSQGGRHRSNIRGLKCQLKTSSADLLIKERKRNLLFEGIFSHQTNLSQKRLLKTCEIFCKEKVTYSGSGYIRFAIDSRIIVSLNPVFATVSNEIEKSTFHLYSRNCSKSLCILQERLVPKDRLNLQLHKQGARATWCLLQISKQLNQTGKIPIIPQFKAPIKISISAIKLMTFIGTISCFLPFAY